MKKSISSYRNGLMAAAITAGLILGTASVTRAADNTKTLILTGEITQVADIEVAPEAGYNALALSGPQTDVKVATVTEVCNSELGYTVSLQSANAVSGVAKMINGSDKFSYTIKYGNYNVSLDPSTGIDSSVANSNAATPQTGTTRDLKISWLGQALPAKTYSDTLTLTITSKS
jgi:spore coat protein U-like protein